MVQRFSWMLLLVLAGIAAPSVVAAESPTAASNAPILGAPSDSTVVVESTSDPSTGAVPVEQQPIQTVEVVPTEQAVQLQPATFQPYGRTRFRYGFSIQGGPSVPTGHDGSGGGFGGVAVRLGAQINRLWGVYYQGQAVIGGYGYIDDTTVETAVFAAVYTTVAGSVTLKDHVEFAFGPSIDKIAIMGGGTSNSSGTPNAYAEAFAGVALGLNLHAAVLLGRLDPARLNRKGFAITLDVHPTFFGGQTLITTAIGLGGEWY